MLKVSDLCNVSENREKGITMIYVAWFGSMPMLQQQNNLVPVGLLNKRPAASASAFFFFFGWEPHLCGFYAFSALLLQYFEFLAK